MPPMPPAPRPAANSGEVVVSSYDDLARLPKPAVPQAKQERVVTPGTWSSLSSGKRSKA